MAKKAKLTSIEGGKAAPKKPRKAKPAPGHVRQDNGGPVVLDDDVRQALALQHKRKYEAALAAKKRADADFRNVCKVAKAELGDDAIDTIKDMILVATPEGEAALRARLKRQMDAARWMNVPLGAQADLFQEGDPRPAVERAEAEGQKARLDGEPRKSPYANTLPQCDAWYAGYDKGEKILQEASKRDDAAIFDKEDAAALAGEETDETDDEAPANRRR